MRLVPEDAGGRFLEMSLPIYHTKQQGVLQGHHLNTKHSNKAQISVFSLFRTGGLLRYIQSCNVHLSLVSLLFHLQHVVETSEMYCAPGHTAF